LRSKPKQSGETVLAKQPNNKVLLDIHRRMVRIRVFEEEAGKLMEAGKIPGALHFM
jgi:pyruvate dehydrogenase E1 component alpha subunit